MAESWWGPAQSYLNRLAMAEYKVALAAHLKRGRKKHTYQHNPSDYHRQLVELLGKDDEEGFKALKMLQGYSSVLGV
jgi:hypothetical protein